MGEDVELHVERRAGGWALAGGGAGRFGLINDYLGYLADRRYSPRTVRAYAFDLLAFARWLLAEGVALEAVTSEVLLRFLGFCRQARLPGQPGGNVHSIRDGRSSGYAAATINRRLVAIAGLFEYRAMRASDAGNPVPRGAERRRVTGAERGGLLGHLARPMPSSRLRLREPRRLPRGLAAGEVAALLSSFRSFRDRAIAGLMLYSGLRSAEVLQLCVEDLDVARGWVRVQGKGGRERRVPVDREVAGLIQTYLLVERPEGQARELFLVSKGRHRGRPLTPAGLRAVFRYHRARSGAPRAHPHALRHTFGTALAEAGVDLPVIQALLGHEHIDSAIRYIHLAPAHVRAAYDAARRPSAPRVEPGRPPRGAAGRDALLAEYATWLAGRGHGNRAYRDGARAFLDRWPGARAFAAEPLSLQLACDQHARPFVTFLLLTDRLRPGYDYLVHRKFAALVELASGGRLEDDLRCFVRAAAELGFSEHLRERAAERVLCRLLIQTGRPMRGLRIEDLRELEAAFRDRAEARGGSWKNDRGYLHAAWTVLYQLGIVTVTPPNRRRREHPDSAHHFGGVPAWLAGRLLVYTERLQGTHARSTLAGIAIRLAHFGRFIAARDPALDSLAALERQRHIEPYLAAVATATTMGSERPISVGEQRNRIVTLGRFLADICEWGWPDAPGRRLVFRRDIPRAPRPLPRYLPPDQDRRLQQALEASPNRIVADALLLARATGQRVGELVGLELDCVHELPGQGAWLKVPLGKLQTERMLPLDEETVQIVDRIVERRSRCGPLPHPGTGRPAEFLLTQHGKRISTSALRSELDRAAARAGLSHVTPHQLRHTYATALVNAGCSLQALMELLGHVSAAMSLRYAKLFDRTVRADYERALQQAKAALEQPLPGPVSLPLAKITGPADWRQAPLIKARLAGGYCLRTAAQGVCPYTNVCEHCPNLRTDAAFLPALAAQRQDAELLADDAEQRGWGEEAARHRRLLARLDALIEQTAVESA